MADLNYNAAAELPDATFAWRDDDKNLIDFSSGFSFQLKLSLDGKTADLTKVDGFTGAATDPNVTVSWDVDELSVLAPGPYSGQLRARRDSDSKDRYLTFSLRVDRTIT